MAELRRDLPGLVDYIRLDDAGIQHEAADRGNGAPVEFLREVGPPGPTSRDG